MGQLRHFADTIELMQQQSVIKIGLSISLSGSYSIQGVESFEGITLWVNEINNRGGLLVQDLGAKLLVDLIHYDDQSSVEICRSNIEKLIKDDKVDILLGPYSSSLALAACEVAQSHNITVWNHGGSTDEIEERKFDNVINAITPASHYSFGIIESVRNADPRAKRIASFSASNSGFSTRVANGAKNYAEKLGFDVREYKFISGSLDLTADLDDLVSYDPDLILGMGRADDDLALAKQLVKENIYTKAAGFIVAAIKLFKDELGEQVEGTLSASQWELGIQIAQDIGPSPLEFFSSFKSEYNKEPDYVAAQGYNIALIIERCIDIAGTLNDLALREAAKKTKFDTFYGKFNTDEYGNQIGHGMLVVQWQNGEKVIVYPDTMAQADFIYPRK